MERNFKKIITVVITVVILISLMGLAAFADDYEIKADRLSTGWTGCNVVRGNTTYRFSVMDTKILVKDKPVRYDRRIISYPERNQNKNEYRVRGPDDG